MSDKRYQVFISATYADLIEERGVLTQALPALGCLPCGLEQQPTAGNAWNATKKLIDDCDYYLLLLGSRYGSLSPSGVGFTHMEYVYAATKQKPILILMLDSPESRPASLQEKTPEAKFRLDGFRQLLIKSGNMVGRWNTPADLDGALRQYLPQLVRSRPTPGWVKATQISNPDMQRELDDLRARLQELEQEREQWVNKAVQAQGTLAHGQELFDVSYRCKAYALGNCEDVAGKSRLSWADLYTSVAPHLGQPNTEDLMLQKLNERLQEVALADIQALRPKTHAVTDVQLSPLSFSTIKLQFRTLGLTRRVPKSQDAKAWWQLTALGEQYLASLLAVRKGARSS